MPQKRIRTVPVEEVTIDDAFWSERVDLASEEMLKYQYEQLEESGTLENFRRVAAGEVGGFQGMWFQDSDAYKWLEAASYAITAEDDPVLRERVDEVIGLVAAAQADDGYLNTYFALEEPDRRWTNLNMMHELYCGGHLIEAAVAHYHATGETSLLEVAKAFADHVDRTFPEEVDGVPGHEEIELALIRLARATDEDRYLDLAAYFVDRRGEDDRLEWELEHVEEIAGYDPDDGGVAENARDVFYKNGEYDGRYAQAHRPVREQEAVEGHSVRAMYLYAATTDLAMETDDEKLFEAVRRLWRNMTRRRTYVTGGLGSEPAHEGFTEDYDLPNDTAYAETCAAIGSIFWNQRLFEATGDARYHDLTELQLYNAALVGMSLDGTEFFYQNVLESDGEFHRSGWFECACCPPNLARLLTSLGQYCYGVTDEVLYVNQYIGSEVTTTVGDANLTLTQKSTLPWKGKVTIDVDAEGTTDFALKLRVPEWCPAITVSIDGAPLDIEPSDDGYIRIDRSWTDERVELKLELPAERLRAHPAVEADAGQVALRRGPIIYCVEEVDLKRSPHQYVLQSSTIEAVHREDLLRGVVTLKADAEIPVVGPWEKELYLPDDETDRVESTLTAIPYYLWDNRDPGRMRVWLRAE